MALVYYSATDRGERWMRCLREELPELDLRDGRAPGDRRGIRWALVWRPPVGYLESFPDLECIFSLGAGVRHLLELPQLPQLPIVRVVDPLLTQRMVEYVALHVLRHHRRQRELAQAQAEARWAPLFTPAAGERRVGLMGLGVLGSAAARSLGHLGFPVSGWTRTPKTLQGVETWSGPAGLRPFLERSDILVCLLPLTPETRGVLNRETFLALPRGASLINAGRGGHVVDGDLRAALDEGRLAEATLDVFEPEPLPPEHWAWRHPRVTITAHTASITDAGSVSRSIAEAIRGLQEGRLPPNLVDRQRGY